MHSSAPFPHRPEQEAAWLAALAAPLQALPAPLVVAVSGGLDSTVLLAALVRAGLGPRLKVVHVAHGLQAAAEPWPQHVQQQAAAWGLACTLCRVQVAAGGSVEEQARRARHQALLAEAPAGGAVLLAHHLDDQAETVLLRLLRGSGSAGLAAMAPVSARAGRWLHRPLLGYRRQQLELLAARWQLQWVDDPTNAADDMDRNFLRNRILPQLEQRFAGTAATLARAATLQQDSLELLDQRAAEDLAALARADGSLCLAQLAQLSPARQRNLLHGWLRRERLRAPPLKVLERVRSELLTAEADRQPQVPVGAAVFRRHRHGLYLLAELEQQPLSAQPLPSADACCGAVQLQWVSGDDVQDERDWPLPAGGDWQLGPAVAGLHWRQHGRQREVREQWRAAGVPPWQRQRLPVLWRDGTPWAVAGLGVSDAAWAARADAERWLRVTPAPPCHPASRPAGALWA